MVCPHFGKPLIEILAGRQRIDCKLYGNPFHRRAAQLFFELVKRQVPVLQAVLVVVGAPPDGRLNLDPQDPSITLPTGLDGQQGEFADEVEFRLAIGRVNALSEIALSSVFLGDCQIELGLTVGRYDLRAQQTNELSGR